MKINPYLYIEKQFLSELNFEFKTSYFGLIIYYIFNIEKLSRVTNKHVFEDLKFLNIS